MHNIKTIILIEYDEDLISLKCTVSQIAIVILASVRLQVLHYLFTTIYLFDITRICMYLYISVRQHAKIVRAYYPN